MKLYHLTSLLSKPRARSRALLILAALSLVPSSRAQPSLVVEKPHHLESQRFHYQKAKSALSADNTAVFEEHLDKLGDYPLKQYLEYAKIRKSFIKYPFNEVDQFFVDYPGSFLETRLRTNLLHFLASRKKWSDFLRYYDEQRASTSLNCHAIYAQLRLSKTDESKEALFSQVTSLWNVGKSQPNACDPLFALWKKAGHQTEEIVWSRFNKLMANRETRFARYLTNHMSKLKPKAELYLQLHSNPNIVAKRELFSNHDLPTQQMIAHGIRRLAHQKPLEALSHWEMYEAQQLFPKELIKDTKLYVIKRLIRGGHANEAQQLLSYSHSLRKSNLVEEILREALAEQDWKRFADGLQLLEPALRYSERWLYWAARAQTQLKRRLPDYAPSQQIYESLAGKRSFYGFLASDFLKKQYTLLDESQVVESSELAEIADLPGMKRARELWLIGSTTEAKAEWLHLSSSLDTAGLLAVGHLAKDWGWYNTGIQAMISGNLWNELTVRFPLAYRDEIFQIATDATVEPTLIYAIARQESAFDSLAKSPVGAMGLMQLMPATARFTAKKAGIEHKQTTDLLDATHNMRLGSEYLSHLLQKFNGNRILVAAAYNAGPHRVNRWLSEVGKERPVDIWIETIPFKETRHYVQNILCFSVIYSYRLGAPKSFLSNKEAKQYL